MSPRSRELFGLLPVTLLVTAGFTAVLITRSSQINTVTVTYGAFFLGCCLFAHIFIRARLPDADPYLFPLAALLAAFGLVMIYRIEPTFARQQAEWFVFGLLLFCATIVFLRDYRVLERYRYTIAAVSIGLLLLPRLPGIGVNSNGAYLAIHFGSLQFQPAEFAKIGIVVFLASYLRETRDVLVRGRLPRISLKHLGPLLLVWGLAMLMLILIRDLGSSVMFFGAFLAMLYVATARVSLVAAGLGIFVARRGLLRQARAARARSRDDLAAPIPPRPGERTLVPDRPGAVRAGRRGVVRTRARPIAAPGAGTEREDGHDLARRQDGPDLRGDHERARAVRRGRRDPRSTCCWCSAASRPR